MMARLIKFETLVFPTYNNITKEYEYRPAKSNGVVFINADMVQYVQPTTDGKATFVALGNTRANDEGSFLMQPIDSVVEMLGYAVSAT